MEFSFFTQDNKSGYKTKETWFSKTYPQIYNDIIQYSNRIDKDMCFKEKIWFYFNNLHERPKCVTCGNELKFRNRFDKPYGSFCSLDCINNNKDEMVKRQKKTFNEKYGVDFYPNSDDFIIKQRQTKLEKYGDENFNNTIKMRQTKLEKYGNRNFNNISKHKITVLSKYGTENYSTSSTYKNKIKEEYKKKYPQLNIVDVEKNTVLISCSNCNTNYNITKQLVYERVKRGYDVCVNCNPIGQNNQSGIEKDFISFISTLGVKYNTSNRKILGKEELDVVLDDYNIAIEFNGLYWHSELFVNENYHLNKTIKCQEKNINLLHIFEDEWLYKPEIVKSIIKNKIGIIQNKVYTRKCEIKTVTQEESKFFLETNHIQGNVNSKIRLGLFYNDELVSLMTFSKGRILMGGKSDEWELTRFCNKIDHIVVGSASKLFNHFIKNYKPKKIVSYSDIRLFDGGLYTKLGFQYKSQSKPNYWYINNGLRYHRFNFRKSILKKEGFDPNKTEKEIMFDRKYYRIYDCGNLRWEFFV